MPDRKTDVMKKIIMPIVLGIAIAGGIAGYRSWTRNHMPAENSLLELYGNVDIRKVDLGFRVPGKITEVSIEEGERVAPDDLIAVLDSAPYDEEMDLAVAVKNQSAAELERLKNGPRPQEIRQATARVEELKASLKNLRQEYDRIKTLVSDGATSRQSFDDISARRDEAHARLNSAEAQLALALEGSRREDIAAARARLEASAATIQRAQRQLADTRLTAPAGGILLTRAKEPGSIVAAGQTVAVVSLTDPVWVRAYVAEPDLGHIWPGMPAEIITDTRPDTPYQGHVGFISPEAEFTPKNVETPRLRTDLVYRFRVVADNPDQGLRQGMPVTVRIDTSATPPPVRNTASSETAE